MRDSETLGLGDDVGTMSGRCAARGDMELGTCGLRDGRVHMDSGTCGLEDVDLEIVWTLGGVGFRTCRIGEL